MCTVCKCFFFTAARRLVDRNGRKVGQTGKERGVIAAGTGELRETVIRVGIIQYNLGAI